MSHAHLVQRSMDAAAAAAEGERYGQDILLVNQETGERFSGIDAAQELLRSSPVLFPLHYLLEINLLAECFESLFCSERSVAEVEMARNQARPSKRPKKFHRRWSFWRSKDFSQCVFYVCVCLYVRTCACACGLWLGVIARECVCVCLRARPF